MRHLTFTLMAVPLLFACAQEPETPALEPETPPATLQPTEIEPAEPVTIEIGTPAEQKQATIDWDQARADFAARDTDTGGLVGIASGSGAPPVPVLLPDTPVGIASTGEDGLQFRPTADGYFAVLKGDIYDMIINGTDRLVARPGSAAAEGPSDLRFEETMTGAQVSFSRYGASYLVEFMCKDPATAVKGSCVSEADAIAEVEKLLISGTR